MKGSEVLTRIGYFLLGFTVLYLGVFVLQPILVNTIKEASKVI